MNLTQINGFKQVVQNAWVTTITIPNIRTAKQFAYIWTAKLEMDTHVMLNSKGYIQAFWSEPSLFAKIFNRLYRYLKQTMKALI